MRPSPVNKKLINLVQVNSLAIPYLHFTRNSDFLLCILCMQRSAVCLSKQDLSFCYAKFNTFPNLRTVRPSPSLDPDLGLDKYPNQTKIKFFFMASLHMFFLRFIHSHTFRSSPSSANQLP